ncbi:RICIN domain-containing protein [Streptomyces sp. VNUA24]|uniref:RICIN domain-containing protein n=1 Tax=Streptomyces sp. VNUA24 TaxID=3031131 RepID=UPI0023B854A1|nr:RICIN domain-containing protein [Streptomyces sp. VNUA24]WEH13048.1 RICIN domain-containing protein [Streptomyces sp. VNUA24]
MLRRTLACLLAAVLAVLALALTGSPAQAAPATVTNATQFTDTTGAVVHAHGGGVIKVGTYYYWFGENRNADNTFKSVSAYRSTDLKTWEFRHDVLTQGSDPELALANIERPKVIYNSTTGKFVMWMHKENGKDYNEARAAVAVSDTVDGDYTWKGSFRPLDQMSRDITLFKDDDGTGYMISASNNNADLHVYRLTADYLGIDSMVRNLWQGSYREAPAMFKRNGVYFLLTSGATGWSPNQQKYGTATSVTGTWSALHDVGDPTTYGSQTAYVLPVQGTSATSYLYMGDRWGNSFGQNVNASQYVWLPLRFPTDTSMTMDWYPQISVDTEAGKVEGVGGPWGPLTARHSGKCVDVPGKSVTDGLHIAQYTCNGGLNQAFWFKAAGGGYVQLVARHSGKCLDVADNSTADGNPVVQWPCGGGANQQWQVKDTSDGYVQLVSRRSGKCLDVVGASTADGAELVQWPCGSGANQQFRHDAS